MSNHTAFYLESEVKQALCDDEARAAASQLEKAVLDQGNGHFTMSLILLLLQCVKRPFKARSNIGYKANIIKYRKEIEHDTQCASLHTSFQAQKAVEVAAVAARQPTSSGFVRASELLVRAMPDTDEEEEVVENEANSSRIKEEVPTPRKVMSTKDRLKKVRKQAMNKQPKQEPTVLSKSEQNLLDKYLTKVTIGGGDAPSSTSVKTEVKAEVKTEEVKQEVKEEPVESGPVATVEATAAPKRRKFVNPLLNGKIDQNRRNRLKRLNAETEATPEAPPPPASKRPRVQFDVVEEAEDAKDTNKPKLGQKEYTANHLDSAKGIVLKVLSPYFTAGRFKEKPLFKEMAKLLTKCLFEVDSTKYDNTRARAKLATKRIVKIFFTRVNSVTNSGDLKKLRLNDLAELKQPSVKDE